MTNTTDIASNKYVSLTTYRKTGEPKPTPVWIVALSDGRVGFTTQDSSWKVRRIANNPKVTLRPCDSRGKVAPGAVEVSGTAHVVHGAEFESVQSLVKKKYGIWYGLVTVAERVRGLFSKGSGGSGCGVVITLD